MLVNRAAQWCLPGLLSLEAMPSLRIALGGELFLPLWPRESSDHITCSQVSISLRHWSTTKPPRQDPNNSADLQSFRLLTPLFIKTFSTHPLSFSQSVILWKSFSSATPACIFTLYPFLSHFSLIRAPSFSQNLQFFSPQVNSLLLLPSMVWFFYHLKLWSFTFSVFRSISWWFKMI